VQRRERETAARTVAGAVPQAPGRVGMLGYIVRRAFYAVLILAGVNLLTFTLFFAINRPTTSRA